MIFCGKYLVNQLNFMEKKSVIDFKVLMSTDNWKYEQPKSLVHINSVDKKIILQASDISSTLLVKKISFRQQKKQSDHFQQPIEEKRVLIARSFSELLNCFQLFLNSFHIQVNKSQFSFKVIVYLFIFLNFSFFFFFHKKIEKKCKY